MTHEHNLPHDSTYLHYPPLKRLSDKEKDRAERALGTPEDIIRIRRQKRTAERQTFELKRMIWQRRLTMLPTEVLEASDASPEEKDFLLGVSNVDPSPRHEITYQELVPGEVVRVDIGREVFRPLPKIRVPDPSPSVPKLQRILGDGEAVGRLVNRISKGRVVFDANRESDIQASIRKQMEFIARVNSAFPDMVNATDADWSEWEALHGIKYRFRDQLVPARDPNPYHQITYRRLVRKGSEQTIVSET